MDNNLSLLGWNRVREDIEVYFAEFGGNLQSFLAPDVKVYQKGEVLAHLASQKEGNLVRNYVFGEGAEEFGLILLELGVENLVAA